MGNLPSFTPKELIKILKNNGFILDRVKGSHNIFLNTNTGKRVVVPLHKRTLPKGTFWSIIKAAGLNIQDNI